MRLPTVLLISLGLTLAIELPLLAFFGLRGRELFLGALANIFTNPPVVLSYHLVKSCTGFPPWLALAVLEVSAFLAEGLIFRLGTTLKKPFLVSLAVNAASFAAGMIISLFL